MTPVIPLAWAQRGRFRPGQIQPLSLEAVWLVNRAGSKIVKTDHANGYLAVPDTGAGPQGVVDTYPGLQSDPHAHRASGQPTRSRPPVDQLQGRGANAGGLPAGDRSPGRTPRGIAEHDLRALARRHRQPPRGGSSGPL